MYADRKELPLKGVRVVLTHDKIHAKDCEECIAEGAKPSGKVDVITRDITLLGENLTKEQRKRMLEIANMCPVHRTLQSEKVRINTKLVE
jgi:putative redox protein